MKPAKMLLTLHGYGPLHPFSFNPGNPDPLEQPAMVDLPRIFWAQKRPGETWDPSSQIEHSTFGGIETVEIRWTLTNVPAKIRL